MCLIELKNSPKPVVACSLPVLNNMILYTNTPLLKKARENILENLLLNHPLDCPICDQGGECDLQDQVKHYGSSYNRFFFKKRAIEDKNFSPLIKTIMTRCIHCTRCVRFGSEIAGIDYLGTLNRGSSTEIGSYITKFFNSEISGNVIDLCPVGALTSKPYAFKARPWELRLVSGIDLTDGLGSNIYINFKETEIVRILPRSNNEINNSIISDKARFSCDFLTENRIENLYKFDSLYKIINWKDFLVNISEFIEKNEKILILIDEELDLENILLFKANKNFNVYILYDRYS
jgi:NADH dehydrogenase (ubiquinone) Fe-S protein 1